MNAADIIQEFAVLANLPSFSLDERGMARLQLDGTLLIDFEFDSTQQVLHLYSSIGPVPIAGGESGCRLLLEANLFQDRSMGTAFALDSGTGEFMACARLELDVLNGERLVTQIERMAAAVEKIREELNALERSRNNSAENRLAALSSGMLPG